MKNLPIKKSIEEKLEEKEGYPGVWKIRGKNQYLKLTSKTHKCPVKIKDSDFINKKYALETIETCAKVYKKFIEAGIYHPDTTVTICRDDQENLSIMITMPELKIHDKDWNYLVSEEKINIKLDSIAKKVGLGENAFWPSTKYNGALGDLTCQHNWGIDEKGNMYAHDLDIYPFNRFVHFLKLAKHMGID